VPTQTRDWFTCNPAPAPLIRPITKADARRLEMVTERAITTVYRRIASYSNTLTPKHALALRRIIVGYSYLAAGLIEARIAYPLDIGAGKTLSIEAFIEALYHFRNEVPWTLAVAQSQVRSLCDLRENLLHHHGVPYSFVGLWHGYGTTLEAVAAKHAADLKLDPTAVSLHPSDEIEALVQCPVALVTHARVGTKRSLKDMMQGPHGLRSCLVYDEALYSAKGVAVNLPDFKSDVAVLPFQLEKRFGRKTTATPAESAAMTPFVELQNYLTNCLTVFEAHEAELEYAGPSPFKLPELEYEQRKALLDALDVLADRYAFTGAAASVLESSYLDATLIKANLGTYAIAFSVSVDESLNRIAILDASYEIDALARKDITIQHDPYCPSAVKDYNPLCIQALQRGGGKTAVFDNLLGLNRKDTGSIIKAVVEVVEALPMEEAVLLFTFLPKKRMGRLINVADLLRDALVAAHINLNATVTNDQGQAVPRICFSTWGKERGSNKYAYCSNVILVGVLTRDEAEVRSSLHAAVRSLDANINAAEVTQTILSADAVVVQQALARGTIRQTYGHTCGPMRAWLFHRDLDALKEQIDRVFPGAKWADWKTNYLRSVRAKEADTAQTIREYLMEQPDDVNKLHIPTMRRTLMLLATDGIRDNTFTSAREAALLHPNVVTAGWRLEGQRLIIRKK